jgi:uncharacterized protein YukE
MASSQDLVARQINGQTVYGTVGSDGSFLSQDGTIYESPSGQVETGITDPATNEFIPNGVERTIDGHTVYGTVLSNGDFVSEDGTLLQQPDGFVEHGKIENGTFLAETTVNGQVVWGNYGSDGSFLSQDGTIYVSPSGQVETGVTTPGGSFLPGGMTYTLANSAVLYGFMIAGTFVSYDGSTVVLNNGTVVTGTLNQSTGIFTGNNGHDYFIGQNSVVPVTPQPDGSYVEPDGSVIMTPQSWSVDLSQFSDAMQTVMNNTQSISDAYESIQSQYTIIEEIWTSPAGTSFADITSTIDSAMNQLGNVLNSIYSAMQSSYTNYQTEEQANAKNFTGGS